MILKATNNTVDPRQYNLPTGSDVAVIMPTDSETASRRDIIIYKSAAQHPNGQSLMQVDGNHPMYDPLMYVLMFPYGDEGFELDTYRSGRKSGKCSAMQYY